MRPVIAFLPYGGFGQGLLGFQFPFGILRPIYFVSPQRIGFRNQVRGESRVDVNVVANAGVGYEVR